MNDAGKAVFLSYAREDTAAAQRIAEALRSHGVEVWFDQSELRGGDAWDQKIRRQINECTLFLPVISKNTQERHKGYFRLEWKLAVEQTHQMAEGVAFVAPVVIDDTSESQAVVPPEFMRVQWTRLPGALPTPQFVEQIKRLLAAPKTAAPWGTTTPAAASRAPLPTVPARRRSPVWGWIAAAIIVAAIVAAVTLSPKSNEGVAEMKTLSAKSIAVLPFENLSADKDVAFFTDGMHDEVITALSKIHDLTVISRTSVMAYRDPAGRNLKAIAADLGVSTILEGTVQRADGRIKLNVQLIDARTDQHLWAEVYVENLADAFTVQSKLAAAITAALKATFSPDERALIARRPTQNQEAYDLYLQGRALAETIAAQGATREGNDLVAALYEQAVAKDPSFTLAWVQLVNVHGFQYWFGERDPTPARRARIKAALDEARRLAPNAPETRFALGLYYYVAENDWARALAEYRAAEEGMPNDAQLKYFIGVAQRRMGQWNESLASMDRAIALNPRNADYPVQVGNTLDILRRYSEERDLATRMLEVFPKNPNLSIQRTDSQFLLDGDRSAWLRHSEEDPPAASDPFGLSKAFRIAQDRGDIVAADQVLADPRLTYLPGPNGTANEPVSLHRGLMAFLRGDRNAARAFAEAAIASYRAGVWSPRQELWVKSGIALSHALAGRADEAVSLAREAFAQQLGRDAFDAAFQRVELAKVYLLVGRRDDALGVLREMMTNPCSIAPMEIRNSPFWASVKDDPRFEEYLKLAKPL